MKQNGSPVRNRQPELVPAPGRERQCSWECCFSVPGLLDRRWAALQPAFYLLFFFLHLLLIYLCTYIFKTKHTSMCVCSAPFNSFPLSLGHMSPPSLLQYSLHGTTYWGFHVFPHSDDPMCAGVKNLKIFVVAGFTQMALHYTHFSYSRFSQLYTTKILLSHLVAL